MEQVEGQEIQFLLDGAVELGEDKRACDSCRRRKVKCDLNPGCCSSCCRRQLPCTFFEKPKPRGRRRKKFDEISQATESLPESQQLSTSEQPSEVPHFPAVVLSTHLSPPVDPTIPHFKGLERYSLSLSGSKIPPNP
ncbi:hypothetical protein DSO57_1020579 [Entomophthora muscae]|uniref:Uncharacterized protein n=1 Tax=Entomophthora muscae TaxID=34485 RepID=A0ACC2SSI5_9FUNG|nr:hypothetical protein DSO57_1020579 [Entomophthora muscae]